MLFVAGNVTVLVLHQVIPSFLRCTQVTDIYGAEKPDASVNVPLEVLAGGVIQMPPALFVILAKPV